MFDMQYTLCSDDPKTTCKNKGIEQQQANDSESKQKETHYCSKLRNPFHVDKNGSKTM